MRIGLALLTLATAGCSLVLSESPAECLDLLDCPRGEVCRDGLCIVSGLVTEDLDDAGLNRDGMTGQDQGLRSAPFPSGVCFDAESGALPGTETQAHIPQGYCSDWGIVWSEPGESHDTLVIRGMSTGDGDLRLDGVVGPAHISAKALYVARMHPLENAANIWRQDLMTGEGEFIKPSARTQGRPSRGNGFTTLTERGPDGLFRVLVRFDDGTVHNCGRPGHTQRSPVAGSDWLAWVENRPGVRIGRLVVSEVSSCRTVENQRKRLLLGRVPERSGLHRAGDTLVWLSQTADDGVLLRRWQHREIGREPESLPIPEQSGTPSELSAHGETIALVLYRNRAPRFTLEVFDASAGNRRPIATVGNVHHPTLTDRYILWSQGGGHTGWEVRYDTLE